MLLDFDHLAMTLSNLLCTVYQSYICKNKISIEFDHTYCLYTMDE